MQSYVAMLFYFFIKSKQYSCEEGLNFSIFLSRSRRILINNIGNYLGDRLKQFDILFALSLQLPLIPPVRQVLSITIYHSTTAVHHKND